MSPATERWVFAYTTPILTYNDKPAFYHFEMPMYVFQNLISTDVGRMYVVDSGDYLVADNHLHLIQKFISTDVGRMYVVDSGECVKSDEPINKASFFWAR